MSVVGPDRARTRSTTSSGPTAPSRQTTGPSPAARHSCSTPWLRDAAREGLTVARRSSRSSAEQPAATRRRHAARRVGDRAQHGAATRPAARRCSPPPPPATRGCPAAGSRRRRGRATASPTPRPADEVGTRAGVEEQRGLGAPGAFLEPDHELAHPRRRPPVHLAQVVAVAVLARADVVLTVHGDRPAGAVPAAALATGRPAGAQRTDARDDEQRRRARADGRALHEPEGVHQPEPQRAEGVPAPALAVHAVGQVGGLPAAEPLDDEARRAVRARRAAAPPASTAHRCGRRRW